MSFLDAQAVFFDFDGVLVDSNMVKARAYAALYEKHGSLVMAKVKAHHLANGGMSRFEKFRYYDRTFVGVELDDAGLRDKCDRFEKLVVSQVLAAPEVPGATEFLLRVAAEVPCFIISATPEEEIRDIASRRGLSRVVEATLGSPRLKRENIQLALDQYGLDAARCLFIGDSGNDFRAATACGVPFAGIRSTENSAVEAENPACGWYDDFNAMLNTHIPGRSAFRRN